MASAGRPELIIVRSLTDSDLGLFAAHRPTATSKQRAININATVAQRLLSPRLLEIGGADFDCLCVLGDLRIRAPRNFGKSHKNWRLGGKKIEGADFARLDSKDFVLIRSVAGNDGDAPVLITFVGKQTQRIVHAGIANVVDRDFVSSMAVYAEGEPNFAALEKYCPASLLGPVVAERSGSPPAVRSTRPARRQVSVAPMPESNPVRGRKLPRTVEQKLRQPHILERMLQVAGDLSAPAQLKFIETVRALAEQLRAVLLATGGISKIEKNHARQWQAVAGKAIGFVDGGLANLSMFGSAPIAARVGGYIVTPGRSGAEREQFTVLKHLIDELYAHETGGVYTDTFPDISALRDAARISIEAAGAVRMLADRPDISCVMLHGALVNPVSKYSDVMQDKQARHRFPDFSTTAIADLLPPSEPRREGRDRNFISVHLRQLQLMQKSDAVVCGVIERESSTSSVCRAVLDNLDEDAIRDVISMPPERWKQWFRSAIDPSGDETFEGQRITDSLLFRFVLLEPGEVLVPVPIDRNEERRAPKAWLDVLQKYPKPQVSYLLTSEWGAPIRLEMFEKDLGAFTDTASLVMHCAYLLPNYSFPVGLDIVDKFARIPDWMSRPVNTRTAVLALRKALDTGNTGLFDSLRRMLCGSSREWLLRPGLFR